MRLLVNTLSIGSLSGEHVVYGYLRELARVPRNRLEIILLHCAGQRPPGDLLALGLGRIEVSDRLRRWAPRAIWETARLPALVKRHRIDRVLNVSGGITPGLRTPQIALAMNPWCYVAGARSGWDQALKAFLQRRSYRLAFRRAEHVIYVSSYLRDLYRAANRDCLDEEAPSTIAYIGLDDALFEAADTFKDTVRQPYSILSVSVWAPWKGVETVLRALKILRESGTPATLSLVGPWPDPAYRRRIDSLINEYELTGAVTLHGKVPVAELWRHYATHEVFCLMSHCESFGIPAAEAMAFGTPVVSTTGCAIAEVCAGGGRFLPPATPRATAEALARFLCDRAAALRTGRRARSRAEALRWSLCRSRIDHCFGLELHRDPEAGPRAGRVIAS